MSAKQAMGKALVQAGKVMFGAAALAFFVGGALVSKVAQTDRILGELIGLGFVMLFGAVGGILHFAGERLQEGWPSRSDSGVLSLGISGHENRGK